MEAVHIDVALASRLAEAVFGERVEECVRFPTGLRHRVFDVTLADSARRIVVRLSTADGRDELAGGVFWTERLRSIGVPVAAVLASRLDRDPPFVVLERIPGTDIGNVIDGMTEQAVVAAAHAVVDMQLTTASLPRGRGFGYALDEQSALLPTWRAVLDEHLERTRRWIEAAGIVDPVWIDRLRRLLAASSALFDGIGPTAFLHDATTKNVIVHDDAVIGLVDVDHMAFGDPLWAAALTRMSLLAAHRPTVYADVQGDLLAAAPGAERLRIYTALHAVAFLGELGQTFNRDGPQKVDDEAQEHLERILSELLG